VVEALLACISCLVSVGKEPALEESVPEKIVRISEELLKVSERYVVGRIGSNDVVYALCNFKIVPLNALVCTSSSSHRKFGHGDSEETRENVCRACGRLVRDQG